MTEYFYSNLSVHEDFSIVSDLSKYSTLPNDWNIISADIENSTEAIQTGHYKSVNTIGVSVITAIRNLSSSIQFPYIFGGDGASLCIPANFTEKAKEALLATKQMAKTQFDLNLRVGIVPISIVRENKLDVLVLRYHAAENYIQVAFSGGGIEFAENLIKDKSKGAEYRFDVSSKEMKADYSGLECRWQKVPSQHGETIALIVKAMAASIEEEAKIYDEIILMIRDIYGEDKDCQPIYREGLKLTTNSKNLSEEFKSKTFNKGFISRLKYITKLKFEVLVGWILMRYKITLTGVQWGKYKDEVSRNTDFKKFDGILREVISGTTEQREKLEHYLNDEYKMKKCVYGIHVSNSALVTCMVDNRADEHYHFVDASDGGYAVAAKQMKEQLKTL